MRTLALIALLLPPALCFAQAVATYENSSSTLKMIRLPGSAEGPAAPAADFNIAEVLKQEPPASKPQPPAPVAPAPIEQPPAGERFLTLKPKIPRDSIKWNEKASGNFNVYSQPRTGGVPTPNLNLKFETVHQILRKNIPWLMAGKSDVYVYQNRADFLRYEPQAMSWSGAFFSPADTCIVMYDEPKNIDNIIAQFSHELTHLFAEGFFNPDSAEEPPVWLNEGLAVNMEDISANYGGGVWASDLIMINILPAPGAAKTGGRLQLRTSVLGGGSARQRYPGGPALSDKTIYFKGFGSFMLDESYDKAVAGNYADDWYFQAYAMVRFLFKPFLAQYPEKRMQFEQFTKLLAAKDRPSSMAALKAAYGFKDAAAFETAFYKWLYALQKTERDKIIKQQQLQQNTGPA